MEIVDNHRDGVSDIGEFGEHAVDHRPLIEGGRRRRRLPPGGCAGGLADRAEEGKPELLCILLIALHLQEGDPMGLIPTVSPTRATGRPSRCRPELHAGAAPPELKVGSNYQYR